MTVRKLSPNASISLQIMEDITPGGDVFAIVQPLAAPKRLAGRTAAADPEAAVIVEAEQGMDVSPLLARAQAKQVRDLGGGLYAAVVPVKKAGILYEHANVRFVEAQKQKRTMLEKALVDGAVGLPNDRKVKGRGDGVVVGIIDSGFDLSHPAFRDGNKKLRVDALLVQTFNGTSFSVREFSTAQLETGWKTGGNRPGLDENGHGTHVASIAAGSPFNGVSGVAPNARFVLVKTDFIRLAEATKWCFDKAAGRPAVVNMSLGGHHGAHDGASAEERALDRLSGPGRIVVLAAGNERIDNIHVGTRFAKAQMETATMDIATDEGGVTIVCWYDDKDSFDVALVSPSGTVMAAADMNEEGEVHRQWCAGDHRTNGPGAAQIRRGSGRCPDQIEHRPERFQGMEAARDLHQGWSWTVRRLDHRQQPLSRQRICGDCAHHRLARDGPPLHRRGQSCHQERLEVR